MTAGVLKGPNGGNGQVKRAIQPLFPEADVCGFVPLDPLGAPAVGDLYGDLSKPAITTLWGITIAKPAIRGYLGYRGFDS